MNARTTDPYFDWLCILVGNNNYGMLLQMLHSIDFKSSLPEDENRGIDGMQLRVEFMTIFGEFGSSTNRGGCTMLEFLVALSKKMSFLMSGNPGGHHLEFYFWTLIKNLKLDKLTDDNFIILNGEFFVEDAVWRVQMRQYEYSGNGGLFPLKHPYQDQRKVEIWYQMHAWLSEQCEMDLGI